MPQHTDNWETQQESSPVLLQWQECSDWQQLVPVTAINTYTHTHTHTHTHTYTYTCSTAWYRAHGPLFLKGDEARQNSRTGNSMGYGAASLGYPVKPGTFGQRKHSPTHGLATPQWVGRMGCNPEWWHRASVQGSRLHYPHPLWGDTG